jgi:hypothetical protein
MRPESGGSQQYGNFDDLAEDLCDGWLFSISLNRWTMGCDQTLLATLPGRPWQS